MGWHYDYKDYYNKYKDYYKEVDYKPYEYGYDKKRRDCK
jgi:hypothetical protein